MRKTYTDKVLQILESGGAKTSQIDKVTGDRNKTYQSISFLRKKKGIDIKLDRKSGFYSIPSTKKAPKKKEKETEDLSGTVVLSASTIRKVSNLPPDVKADAVDMLRKAAFYSKSLVALVEANTLAESV